MKKETTRRTVLGLTAGLLGVGATAPVWTDVGASNGSTGGDGTATTAAVSTDTNTIMAGTEHATTVYEKQADADGPTVMVVGGVHGDETSGFRSAHEVRTWDVDAGTLVVLPEANKVAVERGSRHGENGDLNRNFPTGEQPTTDLAQAIWAAVEAYDPDVFLDLHRASGIFSGDASGTEAEVGQAIFYDGDGAGELAESVVDYVNANAVPDSRPAYDFDTAHFDLDAPPEDLLAPKVAVDLGASSFLVETTSEDLSLERRIEWTTLIVRRFLREVGVLAAETPTPSPTATAEPTPEPTPDPTPEPNDGPTASIATTPADAETVDFDRGETVRLDASDATDPDGTITSYEWDLDDDDNFEESGSTVELTFDRCGTFPVTLRVTDDDGATATASITLQATGTS